MENNNENKTLEACMNGNLTILQESTTFSEMHLVISAEFKQKDIFLFLVEKCSKEDLNLAISKMSTDTAEWAKQHLQFEWRDVLEAIDTGNISIIKKYLTQSNADVHFSGEKLLRNAAYYKNKEICELLIEHGANVHKALKCGLLKESESFLKQYVTQLTWDDYNDALENNNLDAIKHFYIGEKLVKDEQCLRQAAFRENQKACELLISLGADPKVAHENTWRNCTKEFLKQFLEEEKVTQEAYITALKDDDLDTIKKYYLQKQPQKTESCLRNAAYHKNKKACELLISLGSDPKEAYEKANNYSTKEFLKQFLGKSDDYKQMALDLQMDFIKSTLPNIIFEEKDEIKCPDEGNLVVQHFKKEIVLTEDGGMSSQVLNILGLFEDKIKNCESCVKFYLKAIEKGYVNAMINLGIYHHIKKDYVQAEKYYKMAIDQGDNYAYAMYTYANYCETIKRNYEEALKYYTMAVSHGHQPAQKKIDELEEKIKSQLDKLIKDYGLETVKSLMP